MGHRPCRAVLGRVAEPPMVLLADLLDYLDAFLDVAAVRDYGPNGLQVEGRPEVRKLALGVSAARDVLQQAAGWGADAALVHHGIFWRGAGEIRVERALRARLKLLLDADMSLLAYHLPLDRHPLVGNNAVLARRLGAEVIGTAFEHEGVPIGVIAECAAPMTLGGIAARIEAALRRAPLVIEAGERPVRRFGIVSGGAPKYLEEAARRGLDLFLTGEPSEAAVHLAREEGIHFVAAGHHATERFGVQALGEHLAERFGVEVRYFEVDNPV
jgi:dinuclear metal center YbgI/SA1388 family protein